VQNTLTPTYNTTTTTFPVLKQMDKQNQAAVREINRKLLQTVRNDWDYPRVSGPRRAHADAEPPAARSYRERYYGTTDDSDSDDEYGPSERRSHTIEDMYAFDSPDSVGDEIDQRLQERKRKRRKAVEEELGWNNGLLFFAHRRNAWTGAVPNETPKERPRPDSEIFPTTQILSTSSDASPIGTSGSDSSSKLSATAPPAVDSASDPPQIDTSRDPRLPNTPAEELLDVLIPVAAPILPATHPIRVTLSSRSASELYDKVVRDQRTPAVPINLSEMTRIIVQGWKDEGNWPPKGAPPEPAIAGRRRALGFPDESGAAGAGKELGVGGLLAHHPHLQKGVEGVKKVFRLSGTHSIDGGAKSPPLKRPWSSKGSHSRSQSYSQQDQNI